MLIAKWIRVDAEKAPTRAGLLRWTAVEPAREIAVAEHESALGLGPAITGIMRSFRAK
jgi:hypothetical protein